jgi:transcriptional regulator with XRE-family HTH domain
MNGAQCRMARAALRIGVRELADLARVSTTTVTKLERGEQLLPRTAQDIKRALEAAGIIFSDHPTGVSLAPTLDHRAAKEESTTWARPGEARLG